MELVMPAASVHPPRARVVSNTWQEELWVTSNVGGFTRSHCAHLWLRVIAGRKVVGVQVVRFLLVKFELTVTIVT